MKTTVTIMTDADLPQPELDAAEAGFGTLETGQGPLPLKAMDVRTRIDGLLAHTVLRQTYVNTLGEALEATYIFPLPDRAAVTRFRMEAGGRVVEGILKERGAARQEYAQAIEAGQRAAIAEEERPGVFTLRVGNLMPGEQAVVQLELTGPLSYCDGEATFRFPLVVAPRYIPGKPLPGTSVGSGVELDTDAVPDASRITPPVLLPGFPNPVRLSLSVDLHDAGLPVTDIRSSLHAIVEETSVGVRHLRMVGRIANPSHERLNRDFILRFRVAGASQVQTSLSLLPDENGKEGTFLLTLVPPMQPVQSARPRDVVFLLDRSGSMGGWKMVAARRAMARMVDTLTDHDRFTIFAFDDSIDSPFAGQEKGSPLTAATNRNRFRAVEFLAKIEARGGTELANPLDRAVKKLSVNDPRRERILVLVTDGQVGNEDQILSNLGARLAGMRIFTLGIDQAVNEGFLKRLACLGGGSCEMVESEDRLDEVMDRIHRRIAAPVLTNLELDPAGLEIDRTSLVPDRLPDLFAGAPLLLMGRYRGASTGVLKVKAQDAAAKPWTQTLPGRTTDNLALTWTWARGKVRDLEDRYAAGQGDLASLEKQIVQTSLRFGVLCRFTAFVAVDVKEVVNPGGKVQRITQPVEAAAGWAMLGTDQKAVETFHSNALFACAAPASVGSAKSGNVMGPRSAKKSKLASEVLAELNSGGRVSKKIQMAMDDSSRQPEKFDLSLDDGGGEATSQAQDVAVDLTAFRRRAADLWQRLQAADVGDRLTELGVLTVQLTVLIEDLRSIGAPQDCLRPLVELLDELRHLTGKDQPEPTEIAERWTRAESVLRDFAQDVHSAEPTADRRADFWKHLA